jgi:hypothetical protein
MYKVFFILLSLLFIGSADCKQFHDGIFVFHDFGSEFKIVRKGDKQIEYVKGDEKFTNILSNGNQIAATCFLNRKSLREIKSTVF